MIEVVQDSANFAAERKSALDTSSTSLTYFGKAAVVSVGMAIVCGAGYLLYNLYFCREENLGLQP